MKEANEYRHLDRIASDIAVLGTGNTAHTIKTLCDIVTRQQALIKVLMEHKVKMDRYVSCEVERLQLYLGLPASKEGK